MNRNRKRNHLFQPLSRMLRFVFAFSLIVSTTAMADTITWQETSPGTGPWDVSTTDNWKVLVTSVDTVYEEGDDVRFHGSQGGQGTVVIQGAGVNPNSIDFPNGGGGNWNFTGGDIGGSASISNGASGAQPTFSRDGSYSFSGGVAVRGTFTYTPQLSSSGTYHLGGNGAGGGGDITFTGGSFAFNPSLAATVDNNFFLSSASAVLTGNANATFNSNVSMGNNLTLIGAADFSGLTLNLTGDRELTIRAVNPTTPPTTKFDGAVNGPSSTFTINSLGGGANAVTALGGAGGWDVANVEITGVNRVMFQGDGDTFFDQLNANGGKVKLLTGSRFIKDVTAGSVGNGTLNVGYSLQVDSGATVEGDVTHVNSDGVLSGTGNIQTLLEINNEAVLSPGTDSGDGTLTLEDDLTMNAGSTLLIEADSAASYDAVNLLNTSSVTLNNSTLDLELDYAPTLGDMLFIITSQDDSTPISGTFAGLAEGSQTTFGDYYAKISYLGEADSLSLNGGNDLVLYDFQVIPAPEPSTFMLLGLGLFPCLRKRRRQSQ